MDGTTRILASLAAGPLEDFLGRHGERYLGCSLLWHGGSGNCASFRRSLAGLDAQAGLASP
jgi:hypothetical protein